MSYTEADERADTAFLVGAAYGRSVVLSEFLDFVASSAAYNGADDPGQRFYDWSLNPWLQEVAQRFRKEAR